MLTSHLTSLHQFNFEMILTWTWVIMLHVYFTLTSFLQAFMWDWLNLDATMTMLILNLSWHVPYYFLLISGKPFENSPSSELRRTSLNWAMLTLNLTYTEFHMSLTLIRASPDQDLDVTTTWSCCTLALKMFSYVHFLRYPTRVAFGDFSLGKLLKDTISDYLFKMFLKVNFGKFSSKRVFEDSMRLKSL